MCFLQGILTAQDAVSAVEAGASGVIVSNHGGRALDGSLSSIESLAPVVKVSLSIPSMNRMRKRWLFHAHDVGGTVLRIPVLCLSRAETGVFSRAPA